MAGRIYTTVLGITPIMRLQDRSLVINWGNPPDAMRDDDNMFTMWAIDDWPLRSGNVFDALAVGMWPISNRVVWLEEVIWTGQAGWPYYIAGVTKDSGGTPIGGVNVDLYRTVDDALLGSAVSDANGIFSIGINDNTTKCYIRAWRLGPAIQGTTVDTLVGA